MAPSLLRFNQDNLEAAMPNRQSGFTLVEIAIVLVIIGLLLGGVLKGQELINSAKVKNFANDFRNIPVFVYGYQDKFKRLPGDDGAATTNVNAHANGDGNGVISGKWNSLTGGDESVLFWEDVRRANLASGSTDFSSDTLINSNVPTNADGGRIGLSGEMPIKVMNGGSYYVCSDGIDGKFARQLDLMIDDGASNKGSMQAIAQSTAGVSKADGTAAADTSYVDGTRYTVCMSY
jgi:prepilin-type N-terminal cleavage/methylation domain-containing protein